MNALLGRMPVALPQLPEGQLGYWAIGSIYLFAFVSPASITLGQLAQFVMLVVAAVFIIRHRQAVLRTPLFWLGVAFIGYVTLRGFAAAYLEQPELAAEHLDGTGTWVRSVALPILILGFALLATGHWVRHAIGALLALGAGLLCFEVVPAWSWPGLENALTGSSRYLFGLGHSRSGLMLGAAFLTVLVFAPSLIGRWPSASTGRGSRLQQAWTILRAGLWAGVLVALLVALFATKTRTGWFALTGTLPVLGLVTLWYFRDRVARSAVVAGALVVAFVTAVAVLAPFSDELERRLTDRAEAMEETLAMESLEDAWEMTDSNVGARVAYKVFGLQLLLDRPVVGWGPAEPYYLMDERPLPPVLEGRDGHFHDAHVETLARFGVVGYVLMLAFVAALVLEGARVLRERPAAAVCSLALLGIGFTVFFAVWMLGTYQLDRFKVMHFLAPFLAPLAASAFQRRIVEPPVDPSRSS